MFEYWNPSPQNKRVGDCSVRAVAKALNTDWETAYAMLFVEGFNLCDIPNSNAVINSLLINKGFERGVVSNTCPNCYTVGDFAEDHPHGIYVIGTGNHVVCIVDGVIYDTWDSSDEIPIYFWRKKENQNGLSVF